MNATRSVWGTTRSGRRGIGLWGPAIGIGLTIASALAVLVLAVTDSSEPGLVALVTGVMALPVGAAFGWAVLVDRASLAGAVDRPEDSVEAVWLERAAAGTLLDGLATLGLGAGAIAITGVDLATDLVLLALWVLLSADVAVRYAVLRGRA